MSDNPALAVLYPSTLPEARVAPTRDNTITATAAVVPKSQAKAGEAPTLAQALYAHAGRPKELNDVRFDEVPATRTTDLANVMPLPSGHDPAGMPEFEQAKAAMVAVGVGITQAAAAYAMALRAARLGPYKITNEEAVAELRRVYGDQADAKVRLAQGLFAEMVKTWPGMRAWLEETRLGSWPPFIRLCIERAERRAAK